MLLRAGSEVGGAPAGVSPAFRDDVIAGLSRRPRSIPPRWFYDLSGSRLFEKITALPEYYLTRTEAAILKGAACEIARLTGPGRAVIEFGSGSSAKTPIILSAVAPSLYMPIDISGDFLRASAQSLRRSFPSLPICELEADFTGLLRLPPAVEKMRRLGFFPGSTIGNLLVPDAVDLLRAMERMLGTGSMLLIGIDRIKDQRTLIAAYDDGRGVTAEFNLNLLHRINRELAGSIPVDAFRHLIRWNEQESRIEMHLEAQRDVNFAVDGEPFSMIRGETIHTENTLKYGLPEARVLLRAGGWTPIADWTDGHELYSLILARTTKR